MPATGRGCTSPLLKDQESLRSMGMRPSAWQYWRSVLDPPLNSMCYPGRARQYLEPSLVALVSAMGPQCQSDEQHELPIVRVPFPRALHLVAPRAIADGRPTGCLLLRSRIRIRVHLGKYLNGPHQITCNSLSEISLEYSTAVLS